MLAQIFYMSTDVDWDEEYCFDKGEYGDFTVCKTGKFLNKLSINDDILYTIMATPSSTIEDKNSDECKILNGFVENKQALTPSLMENIIDLNKENIYSSNGVLFRWAFEHKFRSTLIHYFDKYPTSRKYLDSLIYNYLTKVSYSDLIIEMVNRYDYDVKKDGNRLFSQAAMCKNDYLCRWLIEEKDAIIPSTIYKIYMTYGSRFKDMRDLIQEHSDKVDLG